MLRLFAIGCLMAISPLGGSADAQSLGHYHLPSTIPQWTGHGFGAGYHAPMICSTHCHPPRLQRYVHVPGCGACGALPMGSFPACQGAGCHSQLDRLLQDSEYEASPLTPPEAAQPLEVREPLAESPQIPMLPEP